MFLTGKSKWFKRLDAVGRSLEKRGDMSQAPKSSCGCDHHAMSEISTLSCDHMVTHIGTDENLGILHGVCCANEDCPHGPLSLLTWPKNTAVGVTYGVFCQYVARTEDVGKKRKLSCSFVCCNDCKVKREKEEETMNMGSNGRSTRRRRIASV